MGFKAHVGSARLKIKTVVAPFHGHRISLCDLMLVSLCSRDLSSLPSLLPPKGAVVKVASFSVGQLRSLLPGATHMLVSSPTRSTSTAAKVRSTCLDADYSEVTIQGWRYWLLMVITRHTIILAMHTVPVYTRL